MIGNFTPEQVKIITAPVNQNMLIKASPGTGKTTTIVERIRYIVKNKNVNLNSIALFTYNNSLGIDMREKISKVNLDIDQMIHCGTIHSFCYKITKSYFDLSLWLKLSETENLVPQNLKYIIFDEYQDADAEIAEVVKVLSKNCYITIIGDEKQQLYKYKGSDAKYLSSLKPDFVCYTLSKTFRCGTEICKLLNNLFPGEKTLISDIKCNKPVLYRSRSYSMNDSKIIDEIIEIVNKHKDESIAILSPVTNSRKAKLFLSDIQSNIYKKSNIHFYCYFEEDSNNVKTKSHKYVICSIHKSKGLEYNTVILVNTIDTNRFFTYPENESLCKLYVALSRAKKNLYIFENHYHYSSKSVEWITLNEHLFERPKNPYFNILVNNNIYDKSYNDSERITAIDYVKSLTPREMRVLLNMYKQPEIVGQCKSIKKCADQKLFGDLIEILTAIKLGFDFIFDFELYITASEYEQILTSNDLPESIKYKLDIYCSGIYSMEKIYIGTEVAIIICTNFPTFSDSDFRNCKIICRNKIISDYMCDIYYENLKVARKIYDNLDNKLSKQNINNIWWLLKFKRLMELNLIDFEIRDLNDNDIAIIQDYFENDLISKLSMISYHRFVEDNNIPFLNKDILICGTPDFECEYGFIEFKCCSEITEQMWLQVMIYNIIARDKYMFKYSNVYIYNAMDGCLYKRELDVARLNIYNY